MESAARPRSTMATATAPQQRLVRGFALTTLLRLVRLRTGAIGLGLVLIVVLGAIAAPLLVPAGPLAQERGAELAPASWRHPFGTDEFGRDILSRVLYGGRISIGVGIAAVLAGALIGVTLGGLGGYIGGRFDIVSMRVLDTLLAFPPILLGIAVTAIIGPGALAVGLAAAIASVPDFARITRATAIAEREREYVTAAQAVGVSTRQILLRHLLPNALPPILVQLSVAFSFAVLLEAGLSFLGLGVQPPQPSWGTMLQVARTYIYQSPSYAIFSGLALSMLLIGFNFLADALRDVFDPRLSRQLR